MPARKPVTRSSNDSLKSARLDVVFSGPMLMVPSVVSGKISAVEVFCPHNGHPVGAVFMPGTLYSDADLETANPANWPDAESFSLLDPHSYAIDLVQTGKKPAMAAKAIPELNHKISPGRRISSDWDVAISIHGQLSSWSSHRHFKVTDDLYHGSDTPSVEAVAAMHRLTYEGVTAAEFCGASGEAKEYLRAHAGEGGTLIVLGEIPYQPSLMHERKAIDALARLAGLDLHLASTAPQPHKARLMSHISNCGHSIVVV